MAPTMAPTLAPTSSSPMSAPTRQPTIPPNHPIVPPSGGLPVVPETCSSDSDCEECECGRHCMAIKGYSDGVCSECRNDDADCENSPNGPYCVAGPSWFACANCTDDNSCPDGQTCGIPVCILDMAVYCSDNHDADWNCDYMFPSSAP